MNLDKAYKNYISDRGVYCSPDTLRDYEHDIGLFIRFCVTSSKKPLDKLDLDELPDTILKDYIVYLRSRRNRNRKGNLKNTTIRTYCRSIKAFLRFCYEQDYCEQDFLKSVRLPKDDSAVKIPLSMVEVNQIDEVLSKNTLTGKRNYCMIHLMLDCGMRTGEVIDLEVSDLIPDKQLLVIRNSKGNKSRMILCPDWLHQAIESYVEMSGHGAGRVFRALRDNSEPITNNTVKQMLAGLKSKSGVRRVHAHLLRHTFATSYMMGGGNMEYLRILMGHYDYSVTQTYIRLAAEMRMLGMDIYKLDTLFFTSGY